ncbi:hypothetical protein SLS54_005937 [Diplodia seriata]
MAPRPFPFPLGVGTDICSIHRVKSLLQRSGPAGSSLPRLHSFLARVFSFREILLFDLRFTGVLQKPGAEHESALASSAIRYLAGRFAAKEAAIKAIHPRRIFLRDVLVAGQGSQPYAIVFDKSPDLTHVQRLYLNQSYGFSLPIRAEIDPPADLATHPDTDPALDRCEGQVAKLSISHDGDYATAVDYRVALANIRILNSQMEEATRKLVRLYDRYSYRRNRQGRRDQFKVDVLHNRIKPRVATIRTYSDALQSLLPSTLNEDSAAPKHEPDLMSDPSAVYKSITRTGREKRRMRKARR